MTEIEFQKYANKALNYAVGNSNQKMYNTGYRQIFGGDEENPELAVIVTGNDIFAAHTSIL